MDILNEILKEHNDSQPLAGKKGSNLAAFRG
jgi:hypothetical protein